MASSVTMKSAVSDYELLNRKVLLKPVTEDHYSEDDDFLPLKPKTLAQGNKTDVFYGAMNITNFSGNTDNSNSSGNTNNSNSSGNTNNSNFSGNSNNSNISNAFRTGFHPTGKSRLLDDVDQSLDSVPVPFPWSPSMKITSNPSLLITPQKSSPEPSIAIKENISEHENINKVPRPVAWSPGMTVKMDPNLFITPEKCVGKKVLTNVDEEKTKNATLSGIINKDGVSSKPKDGFSVRFNLPSSTSGDETTTDSFSESGSPITLRGCEFDVGSHQFQSPVWKTFIPDRRYNPNAYSDESSLDESLLNSQPVTKKDPIYKSRKLNNNKICTVDSTSDSSSVKLYNNISKLPVTTSQISSSNDGVVEINSEINQRIPKCERKDAKYSSLKQHNVNNSKSNIPETAKHKTQKHVKMLDKSKPEKDSQLIRSSSPCDFPEPESTVVREMKNNILSTEYSFPFQSGAVTKDCEYEHIFTRPEFNSTLKVRAELNALYEQEVDVATAVEATLAKSEAKRSELNEKAASCTNRVSSQYSDLIDLNTPVESLCDHIVRMRTSKIASKKREGTLDKKRIGTDRAPDLLEFFTSDLQKELPDFNLPGVSPVTSKPLTVHKNMAFDLYRHNRIWQGIHDF